jgi:hypothetical protein
MLIDRGPKPSSGAVRSSGRAAVYKHFTPNGVMKDGLFSDRRRCGWAAIYKTCQISPRSGRMKIAQRFIAGDGRLFLKSSP